jgi:hypothetical protein
MKSETSSANDHEPASLRLLKFPRPRVHKEGFGVLAPAASGRPRSKRFASSSLQNKIAVLERANPRGAAVVERLVDGILRDHRRSLGHLNP